jgi:AcrR family transcriptional regulator
MPSIRQIAQRWGVAVATATKVVATLRDEGLVEAKVGSGTVVSPRAVRPQPVDPRAGRPQPVGGALRQALDREHMLRTAIAIADAEGLTGLSMRRLAAELGIPTMSVYRHVADKEELVLLMMDETMGATPPPSLDPAVAGWRPCLEALARLQWEMYRRHKWLAQAISVTRPLLAPNAMAHTEWAMRALDAYGMNPSLQFVAAAMVANYVRGTAVNLEEEAQAEQETGMDDAAWLRARWDQLDAVLATGRLPMIARFIASDEPFDLDRLLEFGLQRLLDGLESLVSARPAGA